MAIIAFFCALLGLLKVDLGGLGRTEFLYLCLMFISLSLIVDTWALGAFRSRRQR